MYVNEMTELMNICMIYDNHGNVLLQNRRKKNWAGVAFPGGHVEKGEALVPSVIREIKEETGLDIKNVKLCGVKEWFKEGVRCMVFFYKTNCFSGTLQSSEEGEVFWAKADKISEYPLANDFENNLELFYSEEISELFYGADEEHILKKY